MAFDPKKPNPHDPIPFLNLTETCSSSCNSTVAKANSGLCPLPCLIACPSICFHPISVPLPLPPLPSSPSHSSSYVPSIPDPGNKSIGIVTQTQKSHNLSPLLISMLILLASTFLIVFFYIIYSKLCSSSLSSQSNRRRRRRQTNLAVSVTPQPNNNSNQNHHRGDQDVPVHIVNLDHPIWYITTVGLQPSVIKSITVCKYKKSDGLIEETGCAVCLTEFEDDDLLRLLPKCNHAFHINCIDTWLRSHTNCPLCRAPIVAGDGTSNIEAPMERSENSTIHAAGGQVENSGDGGGEEVRIDVAAMAVEERTGIDGSVGDQDGGRGLIRDFDKEKEGEELAVLRRSASMERGLIKVESSEEMGSSISGGQAGRNSTSSSSSMRWLVGGGRSLSCSGRIFG